MDDEVPSPTVAERDMPFEMAPAPAVVIAHAAGVQLHLSDTNASGYRGVRLGHRGGRWEARHGKAKHIGTFDTALEAAIAYAKYTRAVQRGEKPPEYRTRIDEDVHGRDTKRGRGSYSFRKMPDASYHGNDAEWDDMSYGEEGEGDEEVEGEEEEEGEEGGEEEA